MSDIPDQAAKPRHRIKAISRETVQAVRGSGPVPSPWAAVRPPPGVVPEGVALACDESAVVASYQWASTVYGGLWQEGLTFMGYPYLAELTQRPEYRRISEIIAKEMTRRWIEVTAGGDETKSDKVEALTTALRTFNVQDVFRRAAELDGFFGRGHIYIDTGYSEDPRELDTPLVRDPRKIPKGDGTTAKGQLRGFRTVEPMWVYPNDYDTNNPLLSSYYRPRNWFVMGNLVDSSRLLTVVSREVPDLLKPTYSFGGLSMSQMAKPYVDNWIRTRDSVGDLVHTFSVAVLKTDMSAILQGGGAESIIGRAELFNATRDNRGLQMIDFDREEFANVATPLSSLDKLQAQAQEQMASVAGIPLVVLLGVTPSGLNASSDGEIKTFYAWINSQQEDIFREPLTVVLELLQLHLFGAIDPEISFSFVPLWQPSEAELATIRKTEADTDMVYVDGGVIHTQEVRERISRQQGGPYQGIPVADVPEQPEDGGEGNLPDDGGEEADPLAADAWSEADHPRDASGKFGEGGGGTHDDLASVEREWDAAGIDHFMHESRGGVVTVSKIVVPKEARGTGAGSQAMRSLVEYADKHGKTLALTPDSAFGGSKSRLVEFYKRFGFVENKGRNKDYAVSETMIRPARSMAADAEGWITVHPNGKEHKGTPVKVEEGAGGTVTVKGGAGGKLNGRTFTAKTKGKTRGGGGSAEEPKGETDQTAGGQGGGGSAPEPEPDPVDPREAYENATDPEEKKRHAAEVAKTASAEARAASESAKTFVEWNTAITKHREAANWAKKAGDDELAGEHITAYYDAWNQRAKAEKREKAEKRKAQGAALGASEAGKAVKEMEARFSATPAADISKHFEDAYGISFWNVDSSAKAEYEKVYADLQRDYRTLTPEARAAVEDKIRELRKRIGIDPAARVRGAKSYDANDNSAGAKAARKTAGQVAGALDYLTAQGYDLKAAMAGADIQYVPASTGKALGLSWQLGGRGYFAVSASKSGLAALADQAAHHQARAAAGKGRWTVGGEDPATSIRATAIHELAHALGMQAHINSPARLRYTLDTVPEIPRDLKGRREWIAKNISEYAATNMYETDAELAALVTSEDYVRGTLPKALEDHVDALFKRKA